MVLEWLRRRVPKIDAALKLYLFTSGDITKLEEAVTGGEAPAQQTVPRQSRTTIGDLKGR
jgi:hypothetical protein